MNIKKFWKNLNKVSQKSPRKKLKKKIEERNIARKNKDYNAADNIRDELLDKGVLIEDKGDKTLWKFK